MIVRCRRGRYYCNYLRWGWVGRPFAARSRKGSARCLKRYYFSDQGQERLWGCLNRRGCRLGRHHRIAFRGLILIGRVTDSLVALPISITDIETKQRSFNNCFFWWNIISKGLCVGLNRKTEHFYCIMKAEPCEMNAIYFDSGNYYVRNWRRVKGSRWFCRRRSVGENHWGTKGSLFSCF